MGARSALARPATIEFLCTRFSDLGRRAVHPFPHGTCACCQSTCRALLQRAHLRHRPGRNGYRAAGRNDPWGRGSPWLVAHLSRSACHCWDRGPNLPGNLPAHSSPVESGAFPLSPREACFSGVVLVPCGSNWRSCRNTLARRPRQHHALRHEALRANRRIKWAASFNLNRGAAPIVCRSGHYRDRGVALGRPAPSRARMMPNPPMHRTCNGVPRYARSVVAGR